MTHVEPCGCLYRAVDVPDDQWIGQGWDRVAACGHHGADSPDAVTSLGELSLPVKAGAPPHG